MSRGAKLAFVLLICGIASVPLLTRDLQHRPRPQRSPQQQDVASKSATLSSDSDHDKFVGSQSCQACHEEIFERYKVSPMGRSLSTVASAMKLEDLTNAKFVAGSRKYEVSVDGDTMMHSEEMLNEDDAPLYEQKKEVAYVLGSGKRGRSYLIHERDKLYQSPIGWYSQDGGHWDLSPGYDPEEHMRFTRVIGDGCLYCHSGRTNAKESSFDRYGDPVFHELAIGCERCHGPGKDHIDFHSAEQLASEGTSEDPILNAAHFDDPELRDNVCNQCHLLGQSVVRRRGKGFFSFRPGQALEDVFVILARPHTVEGGSINAVSQVEQMEASRCYQESQGQLGCTSCHDPHSSPAAEERVAYFRNRCLQCHEQQGCSLDEAAREKEQNSCIQCHMPRTPTADVPHTSLTHHGMVRPGKPFDMDPPPPGLHVFGKGAERLPSLVVARAKGIAMMTGAWSSQDKDLATEAMRLLFEAMPISTDSIEQRLAKLRDPQMLEEMGSGYYLLKRNAFAKICWNRLLELNPGNETALLGIAQIAWQEKDLDNYKMALDQLGDAAPNSEDYMRMRLQLELLVEDVPMAMQWAETLVRKNPTLTSTHELLVEIYKKANEPEKAAQQAALLEKLKAALEASHEGHDHEGHDHPRKKSGVDDI